MKKKRRDQKNPGLNKHNFSKIKQEYHDIDYIDKLNEDEKEWLSKFTDADLGANMISGDYNTPEGDINEFEKERLKGESFDRNNARNRDIYSSNRAQGKLFQVFQEAIDDYIEKKQEESTYTPEDDLIDIIDIKNKFEETE